MKQRAASMMSVMGFALGKPLAINPQVLQALAAMPAPEPGVESQRLEALRSLRDVGTMTRRDMLEERRKARGGRLEKLEERRHENVSLTSDSEEDCPTFNQVGNIAVINIWGVLRQYESEVCWYGYRFGTSYEGILAALTRANESQGVSEIVLAIDCPGGSAVGLVKVCEAIAVSGKPVTAVNRGMCCSAATALSVRCSRIVVEADAIGANIGTYTVLWDYSEAFADAGITVDVVKSGEHKGTGEFGAPITDSQRADVQRQVDSLANLFKAQVQVGRRLSAAAVNELADGRCLIGQEIVDAVLADEIGTLDGVLSEMQMSDRADGGGVAAGRGPRNAHGQRPATRSQNMRRNARGLLLNAGSPGAGGFVNGGGGGLSGLTGAGGTPMAAGAGMGAPGIPGAGAAARAGARARANAQAAPRAEGGTCDPADPEDDPEDEDKKSEVGEGAGDAANESGATGTDAAAQNGKAKPASAKPRAARNQPTRQNADTLEDQIDARVNLRIAEERQRVSEVAEAAAPFMDLAEVGELVSAARSDTTMTVEAFRAKMLDAVAKNRAALGGSVVVSGNALGAGSGISAGGGRASNEFVRDASTWMALQQVPGASKMLDAGGPNAEKLAARLGYAAKGPVSAAQSAARAAAAFEASGMASVSMTDIAAQCVRRAGAPLPYSARSQQMFRAAHSTSDFPLILQNIANKTLHSMAAEEVVTWDQWCATGTATDYKTAKIVSLSEAQNLLKVPEGGTPTRVTFNEREAGIAVEKYAVRFAYTIEMFLNDDLGAFTQIPGAIGQAAERLPEDLVYALLQSNSGVGPTMSDNVAYFDAGHNNVLTAAALSVASMKLAYTAMRTQKGFGKDQAKRSYTPDFAIVPPQLEFTGREIFTSPVIPSTGSTPINVPNPLAGTSRLIVADRLTSATRWYLGARQAQAKAIEVRFLAGQRGVQIDRITDGNPLEQVFQATHFGVGAAMVDPEALQKNDGA